MNIIEVLVSLVLFGITLFAFLTLQNQTLQTQHHNHQQYLTYVKQHNAQQ